MVSHLHMAATCTVRSKPYKSTFFLSARHVIPLSLDSSDLPFWLHGSVFSSSSTSTRQWTANWFCIAQWRENLIEERTAFLSSLSPSTYVLQGWTQYSIYRRQNRSRCLGCSAKEKRERRRRCVIKMKFHFCLYLFRSMQPYVHGPQLSCARDLSFLFPRSWSVAAGARQEHEVWQRLMGHSKRPAWISSAGVYTTSVRIHYYGRGSLLHFLPSTEEHSRKRKYSSTLFPLSPK